MLASPQWQLVAQREDMRRVWFEYLKENHVDFILKPTNFAPPQRAA
jgi:hypothetical protein